MANNEIAEQITNEIILALEQGNIPWVQPWKNLGLSQGINLTTGKTYRGINVLLLWASQYRNGYSTSRWLTFKQALNAGGCVKRGEKGTRVIFWKILERDNKKTGEKDKIPLMRIYTVFNVAQCEGLPEKYTQENSKPEVTWENSQEIEEFVSGVGATLVFGGDRAAYSRDADRIMMPDRHQFVDAGGYYATLFHEMCHWTGHANRLKRQFGERFGTEAYAMEELVAELGSAFLCAEFGVAGMVQHPAYIQTWIHVLKNDKNAIFTAAKLAQEATDFLVGRAMTNLGRTPAKTAEDAGNASSDDETPGD